MLSEEEKNIVDDFSSNVIATMQEQQKIIKDELKNTNEDYEKKTKELKEHFFNLIKDCELFNYFFSKIKTIEDFTGEDNELFYCCVCFTNIERFLDKLKKDKKTLLNTFLNIAYKRESFVFKIDDIYSINFTLPLKNNIVDFSLFMEYQKNIILNSFDIYLASQEENIDYQKLQLTLSRVNSLCYPLKTINNNKIKQDWNNFDEDYINMLPLAVNVYGFISILFNMEYKKKKVF